MANVETSQTGVHHSSSENDIELLDPQSQGDYVDKNLRQKRRRGDPEALFDDVLKNLKDEMMSMLKKWKTDQDAVLKKLCCDIAEVKSQNITIQKSNSDIEKAIEFLAKEYEDMREKVTNMEKERKENLVYIATLENKIEDIQKSLKSTVLEIRNLPITQQDSKQDLCKIVQDACKVINVPIQPTDIKDTYQLSGKTGSSSTIVAEFTTAIVKNNILNGTKLFNKKNPTNKLNSSQIGLQGNSVPIFISESLTQKGRRLLFLARDTAKTYNFKYCWTNNGRIFMRKTDGARHIEIKQEVQLEELKKQL